MCFYFVSGNGRTGENELSRYFPLIYCMPNSIPYLGCILPFINESWSFSLK